MCPIMLHGVLLLLIRIWDHVLYTHYPGSLIQTGIPDTLLGSGSDAVCKHVGYPILRPCPTHPDSIALNDKAVTTHLYSVWLGFIAMSWVDAMGHENHGNVSRHLF